jgi:hypothetical protein
MRGSRSCVRAGRESGHIPARAEGAPAIWDIELYGTAAARHT